MQHFIIKISVDYNIFRPYYGHHQVYHVNAYHTALLVVFITSRRNIVIFPYSPIINTKIFFIYFF
jgi:hypothetical protein